MTLMRLCGLRNLASIAGGSSMTAAPAAARLDTLLIFTFSWNMRLLLVLVWIAVPIRGCGNAVIVVGSSKSTAYAVIESLCKYGSKLNPSIGAVGYRPMTSELLTRGASLPSACESPDGLPSRQVPLGTSYA